MPVDKEKIKDAFNKFVDDEFMDSKDILKKEFQKAKNDKLKQELELTKDPIEIEDDPDPDEDGDGDLDGEDD
jgi:hypothetical protein